MKAEDLISEKDFTFLQEKAKKRETFDISHDLKVSDGSITFSISGHLVNDETAKRCWNGETYHVSVKIDCRRTENIGGFSIPICRDTFIEYSFTDFIQYVEKIGESYFPDTYEKYDDSIVQLMFL